MPQPDVNLEVGSGSHARQTAEVMIRFEPVVLERRPDLVLVYGDVNSTVAATLVCAKLLVRVGHVEAGLRSFDRTMPEELNRVVTDQLADLLFTPSIDGNENLRREGIAPEKVHLVGNVMIDTLIRLLPLAEARWPELHAAMPFVTNGCGDDDAYALVTLHRPSNVDDSDSLRKILTALQNIASRVPIIFPIHPRTRQRLSDIQPRVSNNRLHFTDPVGYLDFLALQQRATLVITDSGGIQEETTFLGTPCLTVRENTERPVTVSSGTNTLVGRDMQRLQVEVTKILDGDRRCGSVPPLWEGRASERIAEVICRAHS
jgi:UDP-N-acetylglucosamine 2-epimerase (non-hydrolysing)